MRDKPRFNPPHGNYEALISCQKFEVVYDITYRFCENYLCRGDHTVDQMIQAVRSGKQNILEGTKASGTSKEMEVKLINVARASLEELLADYRDFLRVRDLRLWPKDLKEARYVRHLGKTAPLNYETYRNFIETRSPFPVVFCSVRFFHTA